MRNGGGRRIFDRSAIYYYLSDRSTKGPPVSCVRTIRVRRRTSLLIGADRSSSPAVHRNLRVHRRVLYYYNYRVYESIKRKVFGLLTSGFLFIRLLLIAVRRNVTFDDRLNTNCFATFAESQPRQLYTIYSSTP